VELAKQWANNNPQAFYDLVVEKFAEYFPSTNRVFTTEPPLPELVATSTHRMEYKISLRLVYRNDTHLVCGWASDRIILIARRMCAHSYPAARQPRVVGGSTFFRYVISVMID